MQEDKPSLQNPSLKDKLRVVHSARRQDIVNDRARTVSGQPGLTKPAPNHTARGYSNDGVGGNYQGL